MNGSDLQASIMKSVQPIVKLSQFCGITYFNKKIHRNKFIAAYRIFIILVLLLCLVHEIPTIRYWVSKNRKLHAMLTVVETTLRWMILLINSITNILYNGKINEIVCNLAMLRINFDKISLRRIYRFQILQLIFNVIILSCYMILGHHFVWKNVNNKWYTSLIYIITEFYIAFGNIQFVSFLFLLREYYKKLNSRLMDLKTGIRRRRWPPEQDVDYVVKQIRECRESHLVLFNVSAKLNKCYSVQVLLFVVLSMVEIMYSLTSFVGYITSGGYRTSELWMRRPFLAFCHMFSWSGYYVSYLFQIVGFCDFTASESRESSLVVHELINRSPSPEVERELELFSVQIIKNDTKFSACGFFKLSFPLLHSIAAAVTAYVIAFPLMKTKESLCSNLTTKANILIEAFKSGQLFRIPTSMAMKYGSGQGSSGQTDIDISTSYLFDKIYGLAQPFSYGCYLNNLTYIIYIMNVYILKMPEYEHVQNLSELEWTEILGLGFGQNEPNLMLIRG